MTEQENNYRVQADAKKIINRLLPKYGPSGTAKFLAAMLLSICESSLTAGCKHTPDEVAHMLVDEQAETRRKKV